MQVTRNTILISPIDYSVRMNNEPDGLLNADLPTIPLLAENVRFFVTFPPFRFLT